MMQDKKETESWAYCHECQIARGGTAPNGLRGITVTKGTCEKCGKEDQTLIPNVDYDWPKTGRKAWFD